MKLLKALLFVMISTVLMACQSSNKYPDHWWSPITDGSKKSWEIAPDEAATGEVILSKRNELGILSNFAETPFEYDGRTYKSLEGFWQMMKFPEGNKDPRMNSKVKWPLTREQVSQLVAFEAKKAGDIGSKNMKKLKIDWVTYNGQKMKYRELKKGPFYKVIEKAMRAKLQQNPKVRKTLLATQGLKLKPDHNQKPNSPPAWKYYKIWEELRDELVSK